MTKAKYMALEDLQSVWRDKIKPWINQNKANKADMPTLASVAEVQAIVHDETIIIDE